MRKKRLFREKRSYVYENSIEIDIVCSGNYGARGKKRKKRKRATPEEVQKINQYNRERYMRRLIKENFSEDDYWTLLTYKKGYRTDIKEAKKDYRRFIRYLRKEYKKRGYVLKWVIRSDVGKKGAAHHHLIANRIPDGDIILKRCWKKIEGAGFVSYTTMYEDGGYAGLAHYITKEPEEEGIERNYSRSRNLAVTEPEIKRSSKKEMRRYPKAPAGWYIDTDSVVMGKNPITGREYMHYVMFREVRKEKTAPVQRKGGG